MFLTRYDIEPYIERITLVGDLSPKFEILWASAPTPHFSKSWPSKSENETLHALNIDGIIPGIIRSVYSKRFKFLRVCSSSFEKFEGFPDIDIPRRGNPFFSVPFAEFLVAIHRASRIVGFRPKLFCDLNNLGLLRSSILAIGVRWSI